MFVKPFKHTLQVLVSKQILVISGVWLLSLIVQATKCLVIDPHQDYRIISFLMDNLGWCNPTTSRNETTLPSCPWSNQYDNFSEITNIIDYSILSGKLGLDESLLSSSLDHQKIDQLLELGSSLDIASEMSQALLAPSMLDLDLLQQQELIKLLAANPLVTKSGKIGIARESDPLPSQACSESDAFNMISCIRNDPIGTGDGVAALSIFPGGEFFQKLSCRTNFSSGESEIHSKYAKDKGILELQYWNPDESGSQSSSNPGSIDGKSWKNKANIKRKFEEYANSCNVLQSTLPASGGCFQINFENPLKSKKPRLEKHPSSSSIDFQGRDSAFEPDTEAIAQVKEMIYTAAAMRPVTLGVEVIEKPKRKNVRISSDPQTVAARQRRERISERLRVLQRLVPGGNKMDTASMLDEAANYLKFLKSQVTALETLEKSSSSMSSATIPFPTTFSQSFPMQTPFPLPKP